MPTRHKCYARGCMATCKDKNVRFFSFPMNPIRAKEWAEKVGQRCSIDSAKMLHLLKCTRNLFRRYDVQLKSEHVANQLPVIAKWEHILNVYKFDKPHEIRLLYKLTARTATLCHRVQ